MKSIYMALEEKLGRVPTYAEIRTEIDRIKGHVCNYRPGRGSVDVCACGRFKHNAKAGEPIVEVAKLEKEVAR